MQEIWKKFFQKNNSCLLLQFSMIAMEGYEIWKMIFILYAWQNGFTISSGILPKQTWIPTAARRKIKRVWSNMPSGIRQKKKSSIRPHSKWILSGSRMMAPATTAALSAPIRKNSAFPSWCRCSANLTKWWLRFSTAYFTENRRWQTVANTAITS